MNLDDEKIKNEILKYINSNNQYAIVIDGEWGSGKTYFRKNILEPFLNEKIKLNELKYTYTSMSLYGITSKEDIEKEVLLSHIEKSDIKGSKVIVGAVKNPQIISNTINTLIPEALKRALGEFDFNALLSKMSTIENEILIFDDFERSTIDYNILFGYINFYLENNNKCIIFANQKEISQTNLNHNTELKYILAKECIADNCKNEVNSEELNQKATEIFKTDFYYNKIKEKIIGKEIIYIPDMRKILLKLIENSEYESIKDIIEKNLDNILNIIENEKHKNIRTLKFFLEQFENLYLELSKINFTIKKEEYSNIITQIMLNLLSEIIKYKKGESTIKWNQNKIYNYVENRSEFKFITEYVLYGTFDIEEIKEILFDFIIYYKICSEHSYNSVVINLQNYYWEMEDEEIHEHLNDIFENLIKNQYSKALYPRIVYLLLSIKEIELDNFDINKYIECMKTNIKNNPDGDFFERGLFLQNQKILDEYNKYIEDFEKLLNESNSKYRYNLLSRIIEENEDWANKLEKIVEENKSNINQLFWNELNLTQVKEKLKKSDIKNITGFRYVCNIVELSKAQINIVKNFLEIIHELALEETSKTHKFNFYLMENDMNKKINDLN